LKVRECWQQEDIAAHAPRLKILDVLKLSFEEENLIGVKQMESLY